MADRALRAHRTILLVPIVDVGGAPSILGGTKAAPVTCPLSAPTAAVLNTWVGVTNNSSPLAGIGGNISAAILDDVDLGLADSDTESELTIVSRGDEQAITLFNVDAKFTFLRDADDAAAGTFNMARDLIIGPDARYAIIDRAVGNLTSSDPFVSGQQVIDAYEVLTDVAPDDIADKASIKIGQTFFATGEVAIGVTVA